MNEVEAKRVQVQQHMHHAVMNKSVLVQQRASKQREDYQRLLRNLQSKLRQMEQRELATTPLREEHLRLLVQGKYESLRKQIVLKQI